MSNLHGWPPYPYINPNRTPRPGPYSSLEWRTCPTCRGTGINPEVRMLLCPKCKGEARVRLS